MRKKSVIRRLIVWSLVLSMGLQPLAVQQVQAAESGVRQGSEELDSEGAPVSSDISSEHTADEKTSASGEDDTTDGEAAPADTDGETLLSDKDGAAEEGVQPSDEEETGDNETAVSDEEQELEDTLPAEQDEEQVILPQDEIMLLSEADPQEEQLVVRVLDGKISKKDLYAAFQTASGKTKQDYHYTLADQIAWKRVNYGDRSSGALAENVQDQKVYTLENSDNGKDKWNAMGSFRFQYYHEISAVTAGSIPEGGAVLASGGIFRNDRYEVTEGEDLTLAFAPVEGYEIQIRVDEEAWLVCEEETFSFTADRSAALKVRYVEKDPSQYQISVRVTGAALGTYSGLEDGRMEAGASFSLTVTPYNEQTRSDWDVDAYVKSVRINGTELPGTYENTVFSAESYEVSGDTDIEIEFAKRFHAKEGTVEQEKYEGDSPILMYPVPFIRDSDVKKVSAQAKEISARVLDAVVDTDKTAGYDPETAVVKVKANFNYLGSSADYYGELDANVKDITGQAVLINPIWGDRSFGNDDDVWEEMQITLPATDRYPEVVTTDITVYLQEIRNALVISGTTPDAETESSANTDGVVKAVVLNHILTQNSELGLTAEALQPYISYSYTTPSYDSLKTQQATAVSVRVTVKKNEAVLASNGTITVPLKKAGTEPQVTVQSVGRGNTTYYYQEHEGGRQYQFTLTPSNGAHVESLHVSDTVDNNTSNHNLLPKDLDETGQEGVYTYSMQAEESHTYALQATYVQYRMNLTLKPPAEKLEYYEGYYATQQDLKTAIEALLNVQKLVQRSETEEPTEEAFPEGTLILEYRESAADSMNGKEERWLAVGEESASAERETYRRFGTKTSEMLRYRYLIGEEGSPNRQEIISNTVELVLKDSRIQTQIKWKPVPQEERDPDTGFWQFLLEEYGQQEDKTAYLKEKILDGVYYLEDGQWKKLDGAEVTITPDPETWSVDPQLQVYAHYAGDSNYKAAGSNLLQITMKGKESEIVSHVTISGADSQDQHVIRYGTDYEMTVSAKPADVRDQRELNAIQMIVGLDHAALSLQDLVTNISSDKSDMGAVCNIAFLAPNGLKAQLESYIDTMDWENSDNLNLERVDDLLKAFSEDADAMERFHFTAGAVKKIRDYLAFFATLEGLPIEITEEKPTAVGFYLTAAVVADSVYEAAVSLNYLTIVPTHERVDLEWKQEIDHQVTEAQLQDPTLLDAVAKSSSGTLLDAESIGLKLLFLGVDENDELVVKWNASELPPGSYMQIACTTGWGNSRSSCAPLLRNFTVGSTYADVQFVDADGDEQLLYLKYFEEEDSTAARAAEEEDPIQVRVTAKDGTVLTPEEAADHVTIYYIPASLLGETKDNESEESAGRAEPDQITTELPAKSGKYLLLAVYRGIDASGSPVVGKSFAGMILMEGEPYIGLENETAVYDGRGHFVTIQEYFRDQLEEDQDFPMLYVHLIVDREEKTIHARIPQRLKVLKFENLLDMVLTSNQEGSVCFQEASMSGEASRTLQQLVKVFQEDLELTTDYQLLFDEEDPTEVGVYDVYTLGIPEFLLDYIEEEGTVVSERQSRTGMADSMTGIMFPAMGKVVIQKADVNVSLSTESSKEIRLGEKAVLSVKVDGISDGTIPTGSVELELYQKGKANPLKTQMVALTDGKAVWEVSDLPEGQYEWKYKSYSGDRNYQSDAGELTGTLVVKSTSSGSGSSGGSSSGSSSGGNSSSEGNGSAGAASDPGTAAINTASAATGDSAQILLWAGLAAAAAVLILLIKKTKHRS